MPCCIVFAPERLLFGQRSREPFWPRNHLKKSVCLQQPGPTGRRGRHGVPSQTAVVPQDSHSSTVLQSNPRTLLIYSTSFTSSATGSMRTVSYSSCLPAMDDSRFTGWPIDLYHRYSRTLHYKNKLEDKKYLKFYP